MEDHDFPSGEVEFLILLLFGPIVRIIICVASILLSVSSALQHFHHISMDREACLCKVYKEEIS